MAAADPPIWRLGRPVERIFTVSRTYLSWAIISLALIGITLFTFFTKGYTTECTPRQFRTGDWALNQSNPDNVFDSCQATTISIGQNFATDDTTFVFKAVTLGNMTKPYALDNCTLVEGSSVSILALPPWRPQAVFDISFICQSTQAPSNGNTNDSDNEEENASDATGPVGVFNGQDILPNSIALTVDSWHTNTDGWFALMQNFSLELQALQSPVCGPPFNGSQYIGFDVLYLDSQPPTPYIRYLPDRNLEICIINTASDVTLGDYDKRVIEFLNETITIATQNLQTFSQFAPLPNLIFTCPSCSQVLNQWNEILWNIVVALGSCWSVVFFVATITSAQTKRPYDPKYDVFYMVDTLQHHHGNENHQVEGRDSSDNATLEKGRRVAFADEPYTPHSGNPLTRTQPHRRRSGSQDSDMTEITLTVSPISPKDTQGKKADIRLDAEERLLPPQ